MLINLQKLSTAIMAFAFLILVFPSMDMCAATPDINGAEMKFESYSDKAGKVVRLADEENKPFLFFGKKVNGTKQEEKYMEDIQKKYGKSIERFPSITSCLKKSERSLKAPNLTNFDWGKIDSNEDAAVCVFRVASSYEDPKDMNKWFESQGFKGLIMIDKVGEKLTSLSASWSIKDRGVRFSSNILEKAWIYFVAYGLSIEIHYDKEKFPTYVNVGFSIL